MKVMTIVGTRPEIIKLSRVIAELDKHLEHVLVHTGQNYDYELNQVFFDELEIRKPDHFLEVVGGSTAETIGNVIIKSDKVLRLEKPDAILIYGDTNSCLSVISAKRLQIPVFHMEAGNRCFDQRVPEEINRKIVDHLSDINMPLTEHARKYLEAEGIRPETIIKTGSCMNEVLSYYAKKIDASSVLTELKLTPGQFFLASMHREENVDYPENLTNLIKAMDALATKFEFPIIVSTHPRTKKRIDSLDSPEIHTILKNERIQFMKPLGFLDYVKLQKSAFCVISDSGTLTEESSLLNVPGIMIRAAHERPEGMDEGTVVMSGLSSERILESVSTVVQQHKESSSSIKTVQDYTTDNVSLKVVRTILSYTDYINRTVWRKDEGLRAADLPATDG